MMLSETNLRIYVINKGGRDKGVLAASTYVFQVLYM